MVSAFTAPQGTSEQEVGGGQGRSQYWGAEATGVPPRAPDLRWARCVLLWAAFDWPAVSRYAASSTPLQH